MWPLGSSNCGCYTQGRNVRNAYRCPKAINAYDGLLSSAQFQQDPTLELHIIESQNRCDSWLEDNFNSNLFGNRPPIGYVRTSEIMTDVFEPEYEQPLSTVTIAALDDLGVYPQLDYSQADPWPVPSARRRNIRHLDENAEAMIANVTHLLKPSMYFDLTDSVKIIEGIDMLSNDNDNHKEEANIIKTTNSPENITVDSNSSSAPAGSSFIFQVSTYIMIVGIVMLIIYEALQ